MDEENKTEKTTRPPAQRNQFSKSSKQQNNMSPLANMILSLAIGFFGGWVATRVANNNQTNDNPNSSFASTEGDKVILQESELISKIAEETGKSVVSIDVESSEASFFGETYSQASAGTGVILSKDGFVLTNKHVIPENTTAVTVVLSDGTKHENVEVIGRDPFTDIAFLKIKDVDNLTPAKLGNSSEVKVGEKVVAIGNALGEFSNTVTSGIISGVSRPIVAGDDTGSSGESLQNLFQTDASINQGNSGGPLINASGEVIGINTAVAGGNAENVGFAIPIDDIRGTIDSLLEQGKLVRPYLGVRYVNLTPEIAKALDLNVEKGAYLDDSAQNGRAVIKDSPAEKAGIKGGDVILKVNDEELNENIALATLVGRYKVGDKLKLTILRDKQETAVEVTLEGAPETIQ